MLGNCACPEFCQYLDHNDPLCEVCTWTTKEYTSEREYICEDCGQPIEPGTKYRYVRDPIDWYGLRVEELKRIHIKCPEKT